MKKIHWGWETVLGETTLAFGLNVYFQKSNLSWQCRGYPCVPSEEAEYCSSGAGVKATHLMVVRKQREEGNRKEGTWNKTRASEACHQIPKAPFEGTLSSPSTENMVLAGFALLPYSLCIVKLLDCIPNTSHQGQFPYLVTSSF